MMQPAPTPGTVFGMYILTNAVNGVAPSERAARVKDAGIVFMTE